MAFQIPGIDLNPVRGDSWMGLTRDQSKFIALMFIFTGFLFADPPFSVLPTDILNIWLAGGIAQQFSISLEFALLLTYTVLAWGLILIGIWIYPYNSMRLLNGYINKFKGLIKMAFRKPIFLILGLTIFYFMFQWYKNRLDLSSVLDIQSIFLTEPTKTTLMFTIGLVLFLIFLSKGRGRQDG